MTHGSATRRTGIPWPRTLAAKFLLVVLAGVLLPLALVGVWLTQSAQRSGRALLREQLELAGDVLVAGAAERWALRDGELALLANNSAVTAILAGTSASADDSLYLQRLTGAMERSITSVSIRDGSGQERWHWDWASDDAAALGARNAGNLQRPRRDQPQESRPTTRELQRVSVPSQTLRIERPILVGGGVHTGTLTAQLRLEAVVTLDSLAALSPGAALVIRQGQQFLWSSSAAIPDPTGTAALRDWEVVRRTVEAPQLELELVAPAAPFVRPFERTARTGLLVLAVVAALGLLLTFTMTRRITRSLQALSAAATQVADGKLDVTVGVESDDEAGNVAMAFNRMTESLRQSLAELSHQRSLAAVGEFAASLSHEVRNSLTAVRVDLQHANRHLDRTHPGKPLVSRTLDSVRRLDATVTSALRVARGGHVQRSPVVLEDVLQRAMRSAQPAFAERGALLEPLPDAARAVVHGDPAALEALFLNLLLNAAQALALGGSARVGVVHDAETARVTISDDGDGVPASALASLGTAFHSTKQNGTGLGLPIARRIAESHGGALRLQSESGNGTTVVVELPSTLVQSR